MLSQLIYVSTPEKSFSEEELDNLLTEARKTNQELEITGILLYTGSNFFQVLEGKESDIRFVFEKIKSNPKHSDIVVILKEAISKRSFEEWNMAYTRVSPDEIRDIVGYQDIENLSPSPALFEESKARKILSAFQSGYWKSTLSHSSVQNRSRRIVTYEDPSAVQSIQPLNKVKPELIDFSYSFQPIIDVEKKKIFSYEALLRGKNNESPMEVIQKLFHDDLTTIDNEGLPKAIHLAAYLGLSKLTNLNISPLSIVDNPKLIDNLIVNARKSDIDPEMIILEILERDLVEKPDEFIQIIDAYRSTGINFAIDDFGAGFAGLNLLTYFQPRFIKLDMKLIRDVDHQGPRQAIIRGIKKTCIELGIDIIAEGVETGEEFQWLKNEGIYLHQGYFLAKPTFEELPYSFMMVE